MNGGISAVGVDTGKLDYATKIPMRGEGNKRAPNVVAFRPFALDKRIALVVVEQVNAFRGEAAQSSFRFGRTFQMLLDLGLLHTVRTVRPADWADEFDLPPAGKTAATKRVRKHAALAACRALWPDHAHRFTSVLKHSGQGDAALIAEYGRRRVLPAL